MRIGEGTKETPHLPSGWTCTHLASGHRERPSPPAVSEGESRTMPARAESEEDWPTR